MRPGTFTSAVQLAFIGLVALVVVVLPASNLRTASATHTIPVNVTITRVDNLGDEGIEDNLRGEADLYAGVEINGVLTAGNSFATHVDDDDHVEPFWTFTNDVTIADDNDPGSIPVSIEVWEHDECDTPFCDDTGLFESNDDKGDADPGADDEVNLVLNLETGTWSGDTTLNCSEESPGDTDSAVRVCWEISILSASGDADGDGILDRWETNGVDFNGDGTIDLDLPTFGADPNHKDLFLELDYVTGEAPDAGAIAAMKAAFAAAPIDAGGVSNPDGQPGINLWVDTSGADGGDNLGGGNAANGDPGCLNDAFYNFKGTNFNANRKWVFRYGIVGDPADNDPCGGGRGEIGGNDFIEFNHDGGTIMHEFGHNLNLRHGGNVDNNCKPNFVSVMNYDNQFGINQAGGGTIIDYSPPRFAGGRGAAPLPSITENALNETAVLDATDATNQFVFVNGAGQKVRAQLNGPVDWNGDGDTTDNPVTVNVDTVGMNGRPSACSNGANNSTLGGHHDWNVIAMNFRPFGDSEDGAINPFPDPEPDLQELLELQEELNTTDLAITKFDTPDPVIAGQQLFYNITVTNNGPNPANSVRVTDVLPTGLVYVTSTDTCTEAPAGTLTCELGTIAANDSKSFTIKTEVPADYIATTGPVGITNTATVENVGGNDTDPANNSATASTIVEDSADLRITKFVEPSTSVQAGETFTYTIFVDNLGPSVARNVNIIDTLLASDEVTIQSCAYSVSQGGGSITQFECTTGPVVTGQFGSDVGEFSTNMLDPFTPDTEGRLRAAFRLVANEAMDVTNTTRVTADTPDPDQSNNMAETPLSVTSVSDIQAFSVFGAEVQTNGMPGSTVNTNALPAMPDLACCNFGGTTVTAGRRIQWDTSVVNNGPSTADNVRIEVSLPDGASIIENTLTGLPNPGGIPGRCYTEPAGLPRDKVICEYGTLLKTETAAVRFQVLVDPALAAGTQLSFDSMATSDEFDPNVSNNVTSIQFDVNNWGDLGVEKSAEGTPISGTEILYTHRISNSGPSVSHDVTFRDNLPQGTSFVSAYVDVEGGTGGVPLACTISQPINQVLCPLGEVVPTGATPIVILVTVRIGASVPDGTALTNSAELVSDTPDPYAPNSSDAVTVNAIARSDVEVIMTADGETYKASGSVVYTITVRNNGPSDAQGVVMTDDLPVIKQDRVIWFPGSPTCSKPQGGTLLTCNLGTIGAGASKKVTVIVVYKGNRGLIENTGAATSVTTDPFLGNNSSTVGVWVGNLPKP